MQWLAGDPTGTGDPDVLIVGDLNVYAMEDPVSAITAAGYTNLVPALGGDNGYSYVFDGQWGSLDHALANDSLASQLTAAEHWFVNADEPEILDYNTNFKSAGQLVDLYAADEFRVADHNPVLVDLSLEAENDGSSSARAFGSLLLSSSAGLKAGDAGSKTFFTLNARRSLQTPVGRLNVILRRTEDDGIHFYQVRTRSITSLQTDRASGTATLVASASLSDITNPFRPVLLEEQATVADRARRQWPARRSDRRLAHHGVDRQRPAVVFEQLGWSADRGADNLARGRQGTVATRAGRTTMAASAYGRRAGSSRAPRRRIISGHFGSSIAHRPMRRARSGR